MNPQGEITWLLLKIRNPRILVHTHHTKAAHIHILRHVLHRDRDIRFFLDMIVKQLIVIHFVYAIATGDDHIRLMATL